MKKIFYLLLTATMLFGCTKTYTVPTVVTDPSVETDAVNKTATCHGRITDDGGLEVTEGGICWGTSYYSTNDHRLRTDKPGTNISETLTGLSNGQTYYYRAYAKNNLGEGYGDIQQFTFQGPITANVTTGTSSVSGTTATCYGSAYAYTSAGSTPITQAGICYRAGSGTPTTSNNVRYASGINGQTSVSFSCQITGLSAGTYSYRAFATTAAGTSYGATKTFTISGGGTSGYYRITFNGNTWTVAATNFINYTSNGYMTIYAYHDASDVNQGTNASGILVYGYLESTTGTYTYSSSGGDIMHYRDPNDLVTVDNTIILSNNDTIEAGTYYRYFPQSDSFTETITAIDLNALTISATWSEQLVDIQQYINSNGTSYGTTRTLSGTLSNYHWTWTYTSKASASRKAPIPDNGIKMHTPKPLKSR
ncbi:MAG: hypothetical protein J6X79_08145 [Bacteroidales bacterium]|nr:hypothetical protein [Bacteroidales bacterium]